MICCSLTSITRAAIPSLFVRFVLIVKETVLENFLVLTSKECTHLTFSKNVRKRLEATYDLEFCFYFPIQELRTTT